MTQGLIAWCVLISSLSAPAYLSAQVTDGSVSGTIEGKVIDEKGGPVGGALVNADDGQATVGAIRYVTTDEKGHFAIDRLKWGRHKIFAQKEKDGYPDISFAFYGNNVFEAASLAPSSPKAAVTVRIGPPCGILHLVSVTDINTGRTVNAGVALRRASNPKMFLDVSASPGTILVPSMTDILIEVSAKGYEPWPEAKDKAVAGHLHLAPRQVLDLAIRLRPSTPASE